MGMNRYLDRKIDAANPRTQMRAIPSGALPELAGLFWSLAAGVVFVGAAFSLSLLAGILSVPLLFLLMTYSLLKRFTWLTHWYLGICLGFAPVGVSVALTGSVDSSVLLLALAVAQWTAGFDILYSLQDRDFDMVTGLRSVPVQFGPLVSLWISRACFVAMILLLALVGWVAGLGPIYFAGVTLVAALLIYEQYLVRDVKKYGTSKNINAAFFNLNAYVSVLFFVMTQLDRSLS